MNSFRSKLSATAVLGVFLFATLISSVFGASSGVFAANAPDTSAKVSFTFDDGLSSALLAAQTLQTYGFTGTDYIITHCIGLQAGAANNDCGSDVNAGDSLAVMESETKNHMSWSDIATLHNTYGWEIGSHTVTHPLTAAVDNPSLTDAQLDTEMSGSQLALAQMGYPATDFASPYGDYDNRSLAVIAKYYASHRTFQDLTYTSTATTCTPASTTNVFPYYAPGSTYPYNNYLLTVMEVQGGTTPAQVEKCVAQAKANNQWLILVFHEIKATGDPTYDASPAAYEYTTGDLATIAAYVKSVSLPVVNVTNALASGTNLMPNSTFNDGIVDGWTTDSPTTITADKQTTSLAGHGSFDGSTTGALNSILLKGSASDSHLFSPRVTVVPGITYTLTNFVNVTSTSGEVDFYIDEYDAAGNDLKTGHLVAGITGSAKANNVQVGDVNFLYTPSSTNVASARLQVIAHGAKVAAYVDNLQWLSPNGATAPPTTKSGDVNKDGTIDALDLSTVLTNWNKTGQTAAQGDLNGDGTIDALDLSIILSNWSK